VKRKRNVSDAEIDFSANLSSPLGIGTHLYSPSGGSQSRNEAARFRQCVSVRTTLPARQPRKPGGWLRLEGVRRNNLRTLNIEIPLGVFTTVRRRRRLMCGLSEIWAVFPLVRVDQKPIGRTPRSNLATYTGLFDHVRQLFANTKEARARRYDLGRFSFNVAKGRCEKCEGEGFVFVELLFLPSVYAPCPMCHGARYNEKTLEIKYRDQSIADVLRMSVDTACDFFAQEPALMRSLQVFRDVGLGYLRLCQPTTELPGGEAQRH
jgi:excinuclease ABC subunit A